VRLSTRIELGGRNMEKKVKEKMEGEMIWITWVEFLRAIKARKGLEETLAEIFPPRPFSDIEAITAKAEKAFPDLPEDVLGEVGKLEGLEVWQAENGEAELHITLPVKEPNLDALLKFLVRVGQPGEAIILREVKRLYKPDLNEGVRMKIAGWLIEEKRVRPLELGFLDPATGKFWEINPYTYLPV
jgi:hypothetical protein